MTTTVLKSVACETPASELVEATPRSAVGGRGVADRGEMVAREVDGVGAEPGVDGAGRPMSAPGFNRQAQLG